MQKDARRQSVNWRKIIWVSLILLVVGYIYAQPQLEQWLGFKLPNLGDPPVADVENQQTKRPTSPSRSTAATPSTKQPHSNPSISTTTSGFKLTPLGQHRYVSPAGLYYTMGPDQEHRLVHIMRHSKDDASRPVHGVFLGDREQILETIDEAFELTKEPSPRVKSEPDKEHPSRVAYTVDMQKKIGYEGGRHGRERGNPGLEKVTLVIDNQDQIITTYPSR